MTGLKEKDGLKQEGRVEKRAGRKKDGLKKRTG